MGKIKKIGVIPTRIQSVRLPGKPLAVVAGKTILQRCVDLSMKSQLLDRVVVACPSEDGIDIRTMSPLPGVPIIPTGTYRNGTERIHSFCSEIKLDDNDIVVNIQGDNVYFDPMIIDEGIFYLLSSEFLDCCTPSGMWNSSACFKDSSIVMVKYRNGLTHGGVSRQFFLNPGFIAEDFVRENVKVDTERYRMHYGIYFWRWRGLKKYVLLKPTQNEIEKSLEQMRWIDNKLLMGVFFTERDCFSVNTEADYKKACEKYGDSSLS